MTVSCLKPGCTRTWPRDPVLEIACPACGANVGARCVRPSGHTAWGESDIHAARDIAADRAGHYGECPLGCCGLETIERARAAKAMPLFARVLGGAS